MPSRLDGGIQSCPRARTRSSAYAGFPDDVRVEDCHIVVPELPGIRFEGKSDLHEVVRRLAQ